MKDIFIWNQCQIIETQMRATNKVKVDYYISVNISLQNYTFELDKIFLQQYQPY